jgi:hypothetical protein
MSDLDTKRANLDKKYAAERAELDMEAALLAMLPEAARPTLTRVLFSMKDEPWIIHKAATPSAARVILDAYEGQVDGAAVEAGCLYVGPFAQEKAGERGKLRWASARGLYVVDLSQGKGFSSAEVSWWYRLPDGKTARVKVDVERWPWAAKPTSRVTYDGHGEVRTAEHTLPHLGEWQRIKWGAGGRDACHFALYFNGRPEFRNWLADVDAGQIAGGEEFYELAPADVDRASIRAFKWNWPVSDFIGQVLPGDVGKRVFKRGDILQVENDEQRAARLAEVAR